MTAASLDAGALARADLLLLLAELVIDPGAASRRFDAGLGELGPLGGGSTVGLGWTIAPASESPFA